MILLFATLAIIVIILAIVAVLFLVTALPPKHPYGDNHD